MKKLLLFTLAIAAATFSYGQCTPTTDFGDAPFGVAPDTLVNFVSGEINSLYIQQIDVKVPIDGSFVGAPIPVDSARVLSIDGLPEGLTLECAGNASTPCTYLGGTIGCAVISGVPTQAGNFELTIILEIYTAFGPIPFPFGGYTIFIEGPVGLDPYDNLAFKMGDIRPNPAHLSATLMVDSRESGKGEFRVFDLVGKEVYFKNIRLNQGSNKITYNTSELSEGVYIYRLDAFGETMTSRIVIVH